MELQERMWDEVVLPQACQGGIRGVFEYIRLTLQNLSLTSSGRHGCGVKPGTS